MNNISSSDVGKPVKPLADAQLEALREQIDHESSLRSVEMSARTTKRLIARANDSQGAAAYWAIARVDAQAAATWRDGFVPRVRWPRNGLADTPETVAKEINMDGRELNLSRE